MHPFSIESSRCFLLKTSYAGSRADSSVHPYCTKAETLAWFQQFEDYCFLYDVDFEEPDDEGFIAHNRRRALFLSKMGPVAHATLVNACLPDRPNQYPIEELSDVLRERFEPPGLIPVNRFHFSQRVQGEQESASDYFDALATMAERCNFGNGRDEAIRDRIIAGIRNDRTRALLLDEVELTLADAKRIVQQSETVRVQGRALAQALPVGRVVAQPNQQLKQKPKSWNQPRNPSNFKQRNFNQRNPNPSTSNQKQWNPCYRCTKRHDGRTCPAVNWICSKSNRKGYTAPACRSVSRVNTIRGEQPQPPVTNPAKPSAP